ncbi:MAG: type VII secretion protein EccCa [Ktedonobacterales bacterium]
MHGIIFHRPARTYPDALPHDEIVLVAPPAAPAVQKSPLGWLQFVVPVVGSLGSVVFMFAYSGPKSPLLFVGVGAMVVISVLSGVLMNAQQRMSLKGKRKGERERYERYLAQQTMRLEGIADRQRKATARLYPDLVDLPLLVAKRENIWERRPADEDFLDVRVGVSATPLCCPLRLDTGSNPMAEQDTELTPKALSLISKYAQLTDSPVVINIRDLGPMAITGKRDATRALVRSLLCSMAAAHAPDDVRVMAYFPPEAAGEWSWLKWLPHARRLHQPKNVKKYAPEPLCLLADNVGDFDLLLGDQILPELERQKRLNEASRDDNVPVQQRLIIVLDGLTPDSELARLPAMEMLFREGAALGVTIIALVDSRRQEPSVLRARVEISDIGFLSYEETALGGRRIEAVTPDAAEVALCERVARAMAPLIVGEKGLQKDLSEDVTLLSLLGIPAAEAVDTKETWKPRNRPDLLRVPIGVRSNGEPLFIDLKEAADGGLGVHGLVIGATGSGKSELLRTLVTSLAVTHDPETLNFIFADFKGGAAFADLARLPHAAGMISNLQSDLSLVDRMREALFGEQERRQRMLREAGNLDNIKQYQTKRKTAPHLEPLPYLVIVIDEFAELLSNRPDFLALFVAIGRVGRSLGMHLLLATQRLGEGRIDGLEGHLRYRICLRTFNAQESKQVIGTSDSFYLPSYPGVGYFKVDTDVYQMFKTALVSTQYVPPEARGGAAVRLREFSATGKLVPQQTQEGGMVGGSQQIYGDVLHTDMDVIIDSLEASSVGTVNNVHQVWLPPLNPALTLDETLQRQGLAATPLDSRSWPAEPPFGLLQTPIGLLDKPGEQRQDPMLLNFAGSGGHLVIVGAPQTGKSTFLRTLVASFMMTHTPREVQLYAVDFGGGLLRSMENAPHVGGVAGKSERDKVRRTVNQMRTIMQEREFLFRERRIDSMATYRARRQAGELQDAPFGDVFLFIDDLGQMLHDFDGIDADIADIIASGLTYGVHVVIAASRWADVRPKLRDNIGTRLELRVNDPLDSEMGKPAALSLVGAPPGRGVIKGGLQFQVALPRMDGDGEAEVRPIAQAIDDFVGRVCEAWQGPLAPPIRMLPAMVTMRELPEPGQDREPGVPIGLEELRLDPVYIDLMNGAPHFIVLGDSESGKTNLIRAWVEGIKSRYSPDEAQFALVDYRRTLLELADGPHLFAYACTPAMVKEAVERMKTALAERGFSSSQMTLEELRNPKKWQGPHYFLFVDDYESLVTPSGNPLAPLVESLLQARDIGFHLVLARQVGGASRASFEPVFQRLREMGSPGLIMNGDPQEGALLGTQKPASLPPGRGYLVRRNHRNTLIQTACVG